MSAKPRYTVAITAHSEGIILHKTILSVYRALDALQKIGVDGEILLHLDTPDNDTKNYIHANKAFLSRLTIFTNAFSDASLARNFLVEKANGHFMTFIDGDDLMSQNWLTASYEILENQKEEDLVVHSSINVEFGAASAIIYRYPSYDLATDALLSVYANRWNAIIATKKDLLLKTPYVPATAGYGYEDWHLNNRLIFEGATSVLAPQTAHFIRRKTKNSQWDLHKSSSAVLMKNPLLAFTFIRSLSLPELFDHIADTPKPSKVARLKQHLRTRSLEHPRLYRTSKRGYELLKKLKGAASLRDGDNGIPGWLKKEWWALYAIDKTLIHQVDNMSDIPAYHTVTDDHLLAGLLYKQMIDSLPHDSYDYVIFCPWLIKGGADSYTINYANTIQQLAPHKQVLVIATENTDSPWENKLHETVDFLPFGKMTARATPDIKQRLLEQLIENSGADHMHILNSLAAYEFVLGHATYMKGTGKKLVVTSFSQSVDAAGRIFGYSHTHVPQTYNLTSFITSDNQAVIDMWQKEYGFDAHKLLLHRQPLPVSTPEEKDNRKQPAANGPLRVLWAARLSPEKQPELVIKIGALLKDSDIQIDMYGTADTGYDARFLNQLPDNVHYKGAYDGFTNLPLQKYGAYLYTSLFDGMPSSILEAGMAELPIVSSAVGGVPEIIEDSVSGYLVRDIHDASVYANHLMSLSKDPALRAKFSDRLRQMITKTFDAEAYEAQVAQMLKKLDY